MLGTLLFLATTIAAVEAPASSLIACPKEAGLLTGPFVPDAKVARAIFEVVATAKTSAAFMDEYEIEVSDGGRAWTVFQSPKEEPDILGGGGLEMQIDKCTGAISEVHFSK